MLPEKFTERMKKLLADEYAEFERALTLDAVRGVRVNTLTKDPEAFFEKGKFKLKRLPYIKNGFIVEEADGIGNTPEHHSGQIYVQDPGAMSALSALDIPKGAWVIDLCSAPGGKSSQAAEAIGEEGFLLSNEFVPKRAKICVGNFERLGIRNAMVTSLDTGEFKKYFKACFDLVIVDAPCSGEGMFRKSEEALTEWSEENVIRSAERQREILENASELVKPSGYLLYSTCTYSLEENEMNVDAFLEKHPDFTLEKCKDELVAATKDGVCFEGAKSSLLGYTRRFYPHVSSGEGQFVALMKRADLSVPAQTILYKDASKDPSRDEISAIKNFFKENLTKEPRGKIRKLGENLVLISHACPVIPKSIFSAGVLLGEIRKGVFHPSHQFFSAYGELFKTKITLNEDDVRLTQYLRGEEIKAAEEGTRGYAAVFFEETALGGGKLVEGKLKNHYPKGLRLK